MLGDGAGMLEVVRGAEYDLTIHGEQRASTATAKPSPDCG